MRDFLWAAPFFCFFIGYALTSFFCTPQEFPTPQFIGQRMLQAVALTSELQLNPRILNIKEDADLPEGTVISQTPASGQKIKIHQPVYFGITKKPSTITLPDLRQKSAALIETLLHDMNIRHKLFFVPSNYPHNYCCAQIPGPNEPIVPTSAAICYLRSPATRPVIWPQFIGKAAQPVVEYLHQSGLSVDLVHANANQDHDCTSCIIYAQRPAAGSIVTIQPNQPPLVQLYVK